MKNIKKTTWQMTMETLKKIDPNYKGVRPKDIYDNFIKLFPEQSSKTYNSFQVALHYHCINMCSRFNNQENRKHNPSDSWWKNPLFYRITKGIYRILKEDEIKLFKKALDKDLPLIYKDEYTIEELKRIIET